MKYFILSFNFLIFLQFSYSQSINFFKNELIGFGSNALGMLGIGKNIYIDIPGKVLNIEDVVKISAGHDFTLFLKKDGTVWAVGANYFHCIGDGTNIDKATPVQVKAKICNDEYNDCYIDYLNDVIEISAGYNHSMALKRDGTVWVWGTNYDGVLGAYFQGIEPYAIKMYDISDVWKISAGYACSLVLKKDGTVWGWGRDYYGQLVNDGDVAPVPIKIKGLENIISISIGINHAMAIKNTGEVYCWGINLNGQIGDGTYCSYKKPTKTKNLTDIIDIGAGMFFSIALDKYGNVWAWGDNYWGTLGDGTEMNDYPLPKKVEGLPKIKNISASYGSIIAIDEQGNVWTWGRYVGYLLENGALKNENRPIKINELQNIIDASNGDYHQIFLKNDGTVWGRMDNYYGQLGIGEFGYEPTPVPTKAPLNLVQVDGGYLYSLALKDDGTVWSWGYNYFGQLGIGKTKDELLYSLLPVQLQIEKVKQIAAGSEFGVALKEDGSVWTWGSNENNQLGDGTKNNSNVPIKVLEGVKSIAAGNFHCLAIKEDGSVWQWGWPHSSKPAKVSNLSNVIAVSGGKEHSIALKDDGTVWAWGYNSWSQLGNGKEDNNYYSTPQKVLNLENVISISAGDYHNLAIKEDGTVWFWGTYYKREEVYGWINAIYVPVPIQIQNIPPISFASACNSFSLFVDFERNLWSMGIGYDGQLGTGTSFSLLEEPVKIIDTKDVISTGCGSFHSFAIKKINLDKFIIK